jgi:hypothetical protein
MKEMVISRKTLRWYKTHIKLDLKCHTRTCRKKFKPGDIVVRRISQRQTMNGDQKTRRIYDHKDCLKRY